MPVVLAVGVGGFLGAIARYGASTWVERRFGSGDFPFGILAVNVAGCLVIGVLMALVEERDVLSEGVRAFVVIGLLGSFTTFSSFGHDTLVLLLRGAWLPAFANVALSVGLGLAAVVLGRGLVRLF